MSNEQHRLLNILLILTVVTRYFKIKYAIFDLVFDKNKTFSLNLVLKINIFSSYWERIECSTKIYTFHQQYRILFYYFKQSEMNKCIVNLYSENYKCSIIILNNDRCIMLNVKRLLSALNIKSEKKEKLFRYLHTRQ